MPDDSIYKAIVSTKPVLQLRRGLKASMREKLQGWLVCGGNDGEDLVEVQLAGIGAERFYHGTAIVFPLVFW